MDTAVWIYGYSGDVITCMDIAVMLLPVWI